MFSLKNKKAVITGGGSGIGRAIATLFAKQGAEVHIIDLTAESAQDTVDEIKNAGGKVFSHACNVANQKEVVETFEKIGNINILINNAGIAHVGKVDTTPEADFDRVMNVNVKGVYFTVQKLLPILNDGGSIIFNTSINANIGMPNSSVYAASKGAILSFNRVLATELAPRNIRVNAISPGPVETPLYGKLGLSKEEVEGFGSVLGDKILLKRFGKASEIAKTVGFLASDDSSFITGTEIVVDGGLTVNAVV